MGQASLRGVPESVIADLVKTSRQDVLQKTPEELHARQTFDAPRVGVAVLPAEGDVGLVHAEKACLADGRAEDVPRQVVEHRVIAVAVVFDEGDSLAPPDGLWDAGKHGRSLGLQRLAKLGGDLAGEDADRHEELAPSIISRLSILRQTADALLIASSCSPKLQYAPQ